MHAVLAAHRRPCERIAWSIATCRANGNFRSTLYVRFRPTQFSRLAARSPCARSSYWTGSVRRISRHGTLCGRCGAVHRHHDRITRRRPLWGDMRSDAWWTEVREEIRSNARTLGCNSVAGYSEVTSIRGECIILSAMVRKARVVRVIAQAVLLYLFARSLACRGSVGTATACEAPHMSLMRAWRRARRVS